jgi:hypothetical protein
MIAQEDAAEPNGNRRPDEDRVGLSGIRGNHGMEKLFTGLLTPSLLPVACVESTV